MNLKEVRLAFRKDSGRYDLVNEDGSDNGVDRYLNAGQRYLDTLVDAPNSDATVFKKVVAGQRHILIPGCRILHSVWVSNSISRYPVTIQRDIEKFTSKYNQHVSQDIPGMPSEALYTNLRMAPDPRVTPANEYGGRVKWMDLMLNPSGASNGLIWRPPSDTDYTMEVHGKFFTPTLTNEADTNYWTEVYPNPLIWAAMRQLEVGYRNTQGINDWTNAIKAELLGLEHDQIEHEFYGKDQLEG